MADSPPQPPTPPQALLTALEAGTDAFFCIGPEGEVTWANGVARAHWLGDDGELAAPLRGVLEAPVREVARAGRARTLETPVPGWAGAFRARLQPAEQWVLVQWERLSAPACNRFEALTRCGSVGIQECDRDGRIVYANRALHFILGEEEGALIGRRFWECAESDAQRRALQAHLRDLVGDRSDDHHLVAQCRTGDGEEVVLEFEWARRLGADGTVEGLSAMVRDVTRHRRLERALRDSEAMFRGVFDTAGVGIGVADLDGVFREINARGCEILERPREAIVGHRFSEFTHPDDRPRNLEKHRRLLAGEIIGYSMEKRYLRPDGDAVWVSLSVTAKRDATGRPEMVLGVMTDISAFKRLEGELREREALFRSVFDNAAAGIVLTGPDGRLRQVNEAAAALFGRPAEALAGRHFGEFTHPGDRPASEAAMRRFSDGQIGEAILEKRYLRPDGEAVWANLSLASIHGADGALEGFVGVLVDITARRRSESQLEAQRRLQAAVFNSAGEGIVGVDRQGRVTLVNDRALELLGYGREQLIGQSLENLILDEATAEAATGPAELIRDTLEQGLTHRSQDRWFRRRDGQRFPAALVVAPIRGDGEPEGAVMVFRDITRRKRIEAERNRLLSILEATPDYEGIIDGEGRILYRNPAARQRNRRLDLATDILDLDALHPGWAARLLREEGIPQACRVGYWQGESAMRDGEGGELPVSQLVIAHRDRSGAVDYLSTVARDISYQKRLEEELRQRATHDALTGALNRAQFTEEAEQEIRRRQRYPRPLSLVMFDIDHFKAVNDTHGHDVGDRVLQAVVERASGSLRESDLLARWGGEEFLVLLPETGLIGAASLAEKLRGELAESPIEPAGMVTASFGVAEHREGESFASLVKRADDRVYEAKRSGRNCVRGQPSRIF